MNVAIYARLSKDRSGLSENTGIQLRECREYADDEGWNIAFEYEENDISASKFSTKPRPLYEDMVRQIEENKVDIILSTEGERLHRRPDELSRLITLAESTSLKRIVHTNGESYDLTTANGIYNARGDVARAERESRKLSERQLRKKLAQARAGQWSGGQRPWGYEPRCAAIRESEAAIYRELVDRVIAGESFRQCAMDLHKRGIRTQHGAEWNALKIRNLLTHKRYCGIREHNGTDYPAEWPAVISREKFAQLEAAIVSHRRQYNQLGPARKYLLTGLAFCGACGNRMNTNPRSGGNYSRYTCRKRNSNGELQGCGHVNRRIEPVDYLVAESVIFRLDSPDLASLLTSQKQDDVALKQLVVDRDAQQIVVDCLVDDYATGLLSRPQFAQAKLTAEAELKRLSDEITRQTRSTLATHLIPAGQTVRELWDSRDITWRRQLVSLLVERVVIMPTNVAGLKKRDYFMGKWQFNPLDIRIEWKQED